jgi:hypothetical protein
MNQLFSRRKLITTGLVTAAGASGLAVAARLADRYGLIPPDHRGIYGVGETLTYAGQRLLMANHSLAREFDRSQITKSVPVNGEPPQTEDYQRLLAGKFVPLSYVLNVAGVLPQAKYVAYFAFDESWDSLDMPEALHPQTLLAYGMNGQELPTPHGAPLRMKVPRQLGYKSVKYLSRITVTDTLKNIRNGQGSISPDYGYSWYAGI